MILEILKNGWGLGNRTIDYIHNINTDYSDIYIFCYTGGTIVLKRSIVNNTEQQYLIHELIKKIPEYAIQPIGGEYKGFFAYEMGGSKSRLILHKLAEFVSELHNSLQKQTQLQRRFDITIGDRYPIETINKYFLKDFSTRLIINNILKNIEIPKDINCIKQICHMDISPDNLLISNSSPRGYPMLIDFDISRVTERSRDIAVCMNNFNLNKRQKKAFIKEYNIHADIPLTDDEVHYMDHFLLDEYNRRLIYTINYSVISKKPMLKIAKKLKKLYMKIGELK